MPTAAPTPPSGTPDGFPAAVPRAEHGNLVDPAAFRTVMGEVCTAVTVVTAMDGNRPHGTTVSAFSSLSLDPPLVLVSLDRGSQLLEVIAAAGRFGVNVLSGDQTALAARFATRGPDKFDGVAWRSDWISPRLEGVAGFLDCEVTATLDGGDHVIVQGLVRGAEVEAQQGNPPLTYHRRTFGTHVPL
jgi:flavin reductase (DIM6/NTAB) family NADH-FMN oxidoreductase RutF